MASKKKTETVAETPEDTEVLDLDRFAQKDAPARLAEACKERPDRHASEDTEEIDVKAKVRGVVKKYDFCNRTPTLIHHRLRAGPLADTLVEVDADTVKAAWREYMKYKGRGDQEDFLLMLGELVGELGRTYYRVVHVNLDD